MGKEFALSSSSHAALNAGLTNIFDNKALTQYHQAALHADNCNSAFGLAAGYGLETKTPDIAPIASIFAPAA